MATISKTRTSIDASTAIGVTRVVFGLLFVVHGTTKLFGFPEGTPAALGAWPYWWAGVLEVLLGTLITIGLFTRPAAFVASGMMAVAYFWRHFPDSFWPIVNGGEAAVLYCFVFLMLVFTGPGGLTLERRRGVSPARQ